MISRRTLAALIPASFLAWLALPALATASTDDITTELRARLARRKWMFERQCGCSHSWGISIFDCNRDGTPFAYSYAGSGPTKTPNILTGTYQHIQVRGLGDTAIEAIDDWYGNLPAGQYETIIWRVKPEMASDFDFDTKTTRWQVYSRMALIPRG